MPPRRLTRLEEAAPVFEQLGTPLEDDLKVTATAPEDPANSIEETERRNQIIEVLREDRQSEDPNLQNAAAMLMTCSEEPDPLSGADDPAKPLVACSAEGPLPLAPAPCSTGGRRGQRQTSDR